MTGDRHFSRVHLQVLAGVSDESPGDSERELTVYARSVGDIGWRLIPVQGQPGYFRQATSAVPVYSLVISSPSPLELEAKHLRLLCGDHWSWPDRVYGESELVVSVPEERLLSNFRKLGLPHVLEVRLNGPARGVVERSRGAINWQGDGWLLGLSLVQSLSVTLFLLYMRRRMFRVVARPQTVSPDDQPLLFGAASLMQFFLVVLLGCQLVFYCGAAASQRSAMESMSGLLCLLVLLSAGTWLLRWLLLRVEPRMLAVSGCLLPFLAAFFSEQLSEGLGVAPAAESRRCVEAGQLLWEQGWGGLPSISERISVAEVRQSLVFGMPAVWLFGPEVVSVQKLGLVLQVACGLMFFWLATRIGGVRAAAAGLFLLLVAEPEFRLLGASGSPRIAECFCLLLLWAGFELVRTWLARLAATGVEFPAFGWVVSCLFLAFVLTIFELVSSRGLCVAAALIPAVLLLSGLRRREGSGGVSVPWGAMLAGLLLAIGTSWLVSVGVDRQIRNYLPSNRLAALDVRAELSGVQSGTDGTGRSVAIWRDVYFPLVPEVQREELADRKLTHEKLSAGASLFGTMLRKAMVYARSADSFDLDLNKPIAGYPVLRAILRYGLAAWIVVLAILRLWNADGVQQSAAEVFPVCTVLSLLSVLLVMSPARAEDSLLWLMPICWSAGLLIVRQPAGDSEVFAGIPRAVFPGAVILSIVILVHSGVGMLVDRKGGTFARISPVKPTAERLSTPAATVLDRVSVTVRFPVRKAEQNAEQKAGQKAGQKAELKAGQKAVEEVRILNEAGELQSLRFFLSGGQRASRSGRIDWKDVPVRYSVYIDDRLWKRGPISELGEPQYYEVNSKFWTVPGQGAGNYVFVRLVLECTGDVNLERLRQRPAVALEYPWPGMVEEVRSNRPAL
ncbi:MAG: hypothetical protein RLZZ458_3690 [Planctomycetota bacterium]